MDLILFIVTICLMLDQVVNEPFQRRRKNPEFLPVPTNITMHRGETAMLRCHIRNPGPKVVVWRKNGTDAPLTIGKEVFSQDKHMAIEVTKISENEVKYILIIKDLQRKHDGMYLCQVTATKLYANYITLKVLDEPYKPKESLIIAGTQFVNQDETIEIVCNVTGATRAPEDLDWFLDGQRIVLSDPRWKDRTSIVKWKEGKQFISQLTVERSKLEDFGTYVCRSSDANVDGFRVNVLSDEKTTTKIDKRDQHANLSHVAKSSATHTFPLSNILQISLIIIVINLTSKYFNLFELNNTQSSRTYLGLNNFYFHR
ncbi:hypothetical protein ACF0H5_013019 [Mactra antiquata]